MKKIIVLMLCLMLQKGMSQICYLTFNNENQKTGCPIWRSLIDEIKKQVPVSDLTKSSITPYQNDLYGAEAEKFSKDFLEFIIYDSTKTPTPIRIDFWFSQNDDYSQVRVTKLKFGAKVLNEDQAVAYQQEYFAL